LKNGSWQFTKTIHNSKNELSNKDYSLDAFMLQFILTINSCHASLEGGSFEFQSSLA